jgi:hypothetical protein
MADAQIWSILESCWGKERRTRASAFQIFEALRDHLSSSQAVQYDIEFPSSLPASSLPRELLLEGNNWYALQNPRLPKALEIDLVFETEHNTKVTCVRYDLTNIRCDPLRL